MRLVDLTAGGAHTLTVCNACRYCEQYCPVFPAMEARTTFASADLSYLANLCHNCGECLYACQYAPPHEFGIDVPRTLAEIRVASYEAYVWPRTLAAAFRAHSVLTALALVIALSVLMLRLARLTGSAAPAADADFYAVMPHGVMVALFGSVFAFAVLATALGVLRFVRDISRSEERLPPAVGSSRQPSSRAQRSSGWRALRDGMTLRHLHGNGADCVSGEEERRPWRRWSHHCVVSGFLLCLASTSVAAVYHTFFGWRAPYEYSSVPVVFGTLGGVALLVGCAGQWVVRGRRDPALRDPRQDGPDQAFIALLFIVSFTGLALLVRRHSIVMDRLLALHLGAVLALFVTLPYGKFVHGFYRLAALWIYERNRLL